jgi:UTP-glucose-1-phosphate uridylyltransferase
MAMLKIDGFLVYEENKYTNKPRISFLMYDPTPYGSERIVIRQHTIEVAVPDDFDPRPQMVATLEAKKRQLRAEFAAKVTEIDAQIQKRLAIENTVDA